MGRAPRPTAAEHEADPGPILRPKGRCDEQRRQPEQEPPSGAEPYRQEFDIQLPYIGFGSTK